MFRVRMSIDNFLKYAMDASIENEYAGMVFLLCRTADGKKLQDELYEDWSSLDDLTGEHLLFVVAGTDQSRGVPDTHEPVAYEAPGVAIESRLAWNSPWVKSFLHRIPSARYWGNYTHPPEDKESFRAAITSSTSTAARFFEISEKLLPCIVVLPTIPGKGVVVSLAGCQSNFSIYVFLRSLLIDFEPIINKIEQHKQSLLELHKKKQFLQRDLEREIRTIENFKKDWESQRNSVLLWLEKAMEVRDYRNSSSIIASWLKGESDSIPYYEETINSLLKTIKEKEGDTLLYKRLCNKLLRAAQRRSNLNRSAFGHESSLSKQLKMDIGYIDKEMRSGEKALKETMSNYTISSAAERVAKEGGFTIDYSVRTSSQSKTRYIWDIVYYHPCRDTMSGRRYDIAISYASEDVEIARQIANKLRENNVSVFYAGFETSRLWGENLHDFLIDVFANRSRFSLILFSENYSQKMWARLERQAAQAAAFIKQKNMLLPIKLDDSEPEGLIPTIGYLDLRKVGIDGIVKALLEKLKEAG